MKNSTNPDSKIPPLAAECWLHRSRTVCLLALAFWTFSLTKLALGMGMLNTLHPTEDRLAKLGYAMGIWLFAMLARNCKQLSERLFYCIGVLYFGVVGIRGVIPMSGASVWICSSLGEALSAIEIMISAMIIFWHFRVGTHGTVSQK